jgi:phage baseplate assembly protein W
MKGVMMSENDQDINESLHILLNTTLGERIMLPGYGCNLIDLLFENIDLTIKTIFKDQIETAILYHEPRIDPIKIQIIDEGALEGRVTIHIEYKIRITNSRHNVVFPFYKLEGTEVK